MSGVTNTRDARHIHEAGREALDGNGTVLVEAGAHQNGKVAELHACITTLPRVIDDGMATYLVGDLVQCDSCCRGQTDLHQCD